MLSIPIINDMSTPSTRAAYLSELRRAGADRVFLSLDGSTVSQSENLNQKMALFTENINFYTAAGLDVGIWINGLGHGGALAHEQKMKYANYTHIRGLANAGEAEDSFCPEDPAFYEAYSTVVCALVKAGARMIMIDDDLRMALHGACHIGCACPIHIRLFNERAKAAGLADHDYTREELAEVIFTGKPNPLRRVWLDLQGDTLRKFAANLRRDVDAIDPTVRLGHCAVLSTWDVDGVDSIELARIFAGNTRPFLRLIGAPYWVWTNGFRTSDIGSVIDLERMQLDWCAQNAPEIEVFTEGDAYPRPRYKVPESWLEVFDQVIGAEGQADGILKYMIDYTHHPLYETGYIDRHAYYAPLRGQIKAAFAGMKTAGVYVHEVINKLADLDCTGLSEMDIIDRFKPMSINFANAASLPISFTRTDENGCALVFGENAKYLDDATAAMPMILDIAAAQILTERGVDVGLRSIKEAPMAQSESFADWKETIPAGPLGGACQGCFFDAEIDEKACVLSTFNGDDKCWVGSYTYENAAGQRFLVYTCDVETLAPMETLMRSYPHQEQLFDAVEWLQGRPLPAQLKKEPGAYVFCRRAADGALAVGIWNFGQDPILPCRVKLDGVYREITPIADTSVRPDGEYAVLGDVIAPYGFAGFVAK